MFVLLVYYESIVFSTLLAYDILSRLVIQVVKTVSVSDYIHARSVLETQCRKGHTRAILIIARIKSKSVKHNCQAL